MSEATRQKAKIGVLLVSESGMEMVQLWERTHQSVILMRDKH